MDLTDKSRTVREGEQFDIPGVERFLKQSIPGLRGDLAVEQFPSGYSNLTYLIRVGDTELVLRRPPFGTKAKTAHDMKREYTILQALTPVFPYCPKPLVYTEDASVMGCPFYVMERIRGIILRRDLPPGLAVTPGDAHKLCERLIDVQLELHALDYQAIGLADFGRPEGYVKRQIDGWSQRYRNARTDDAPDFEPVMQWLQEKMPRETDRPCIIHNDFKFDNVVLSPDDPLRIIGVLDWEMATIGDPLMDLGSSLAYWIQADDPPEFQAIRMMPTDIPGAMTRSEMIARYAQRSGLQIHTFDFYYCFGLFRLAGIAQQIYYRYYHRQTRDDRFALLIFAVKALEGAAMRVINNASL